MKKIITFMKMMKMNSRKESSSSNILTKISMFVLGVVVAFIVLQTISSVIHNREPKQIYNSFELILQYKNCIVLSKSQENDTTYILELQNPVQPYKYDGHNHHENINSVKVRVYDYVYFKIFIGDIIK